MFLKICRPLNSSFPPNPIWNHHSVMILEIVAGQHICPLLYSRQQIQRCVVLCFVCVYFTIAINWAVCLCVHAPVCLCLCIHTLRDHTNRQTDVWWNAIPCLMHSLEILFSKTVYWQVKLFKIYYAEKNEYKTVYCMIPIRETEMEGGRGGERERQARKKIHQNVKSDYIWIVRLWVIFILFFSFIFQKIYDDPFVTFTAREEDSFWKNILV